MALLLASPLLADGSDRIRFGNEWFTLREVDVRSRHVANHYLPEGSTGRDFRQRLSVHHYPLLRNPELIVREVGVRLDERGGERDSFRILRAGSSERRAAIVIRRTMATGERWFQVVEYREVPGMEGLVAHEYLYVQPASEAGHGEILIDSKEPLWLRAFLQTDWPTPRTEPPRSVPGEPAPPTPVELSFESLPVSPTTGSEILVDAGFARANGTAVPTAPFSFRAPLQTSNLYIDYPREETEGFVKLSLADPSRRLIENIRFLEVTLPPEDVDRVDWGASFLRGQVAGGFLSSLEDVRLDHLVATKVDDCDAVVALASFREGGARFLARVTLFLPAGRDKGIIAFSQVNPLLSGVADTERLKTGGVMARVAHSVRFPPVGEE